MTTPRRFGPLNPRVRAIEDLLPPGGTSQLVDLSSAQTLSNKVLTAPDINGGTADALTSLSIRSSGAAFDLFFKMTEAISANRDITWNVNNANRSVTLKTDLTVEKGTFTPTLGDGTNNYTLSTALGWYTLIVDMVFVDVNISWSSIGSAGAAQLRMGGLPFTALNTTDYRATSNFGFISGIDTTATLNQVTGLIIENGTTIFLYRVNDNAAPTGLPANGSSGSGTLVMQSVYRKN